MFLEFQISSSVFCYYLLEGLYSLNSSYLVQSSVFYSFAGAVGNYFSIFIFDILITIIRIRVIILILIIVFH